MREKYPPRIRIQLPISRKPISGEMLVCAGGRWQVCYQARGKIEDRKTTAWVYGPDSRFFCEAGKEDYLTNLPLPDETPFFDDQFNFALEEVDEDGCRYSRLAGASNMSVALAAYDVLKRTSNRIVRMRQGIRVVRRSDQEN
ncbi:hypothetical protein [Rhizobium rhizogenes]|uniref:hypothetical protein n=1 Tax=Rhizobium rhizogenes TaxID=359 RepID=UPI0022BEF562|nr:hypothetical protein [Rhizobium rhizogenes]MCZ7488154.1 hypothetical protein [Rhizobium rhizogenes]